MDSLLPELLGIVVSYLDRRSLLNFSSCSRKCRAASTPHIFSTLDIIGDSPERFASSVASAVEMLELTSSYKHIRHMRVNARYTWYMDAWYDFEYKGFWNRPPEDRSYTSLPHFYLHLNPSELDLDKQWPALCDLIKSLPALRDLVWACQEQIPLCVLECLMAPRVRLHILRFELQSLYNQDGQPPQISEHHLQIATSSCLYNIDRVTYMHPYNDHTEDALFEMVAGAAPNLKHLRMRWAEGPSGPWLFRARSIARSQPRYPWRPGTLQRPLNSPGALDSVMLLGQRTQATLRKLSHFTDFSALRSLSLYGKLDNLTVQWLHEDCRFLSLEHLTLGWQAAPVDVGFITSLPSLRSVCLYNCYETEALYRIIEHCAHRLRSIHCKSNFVDTDIIAKLSRTSPRLESLAFCMVRHAGSIEELTMYHSFGRLPALQQAELQFHPHQNLDDYVEEPSSPESLDQLYSILVDISIDKALANSIFRAIASAKPLHAMPFENLRLSTTTTWHRHYSSLLAFFGRSWQCTRWSSCNSDDVHCVANDLCEQQGRKLDPDKTSIVAPAIHRAWPNSREVPIEVAWHSFPLHTGDAA